MHGARPLRSTRRLQNLTGVMPAWWKIENKAAPNLPTLVSIYDEIGLYGTSAGDFLAELRDIPGDIELHLNSPGGDVFDGIAIFNQLKQAQKRGKVCVVVDGLAASAASFIAQAASPGCLEMAPHSQMMIHDGFAMGIGNAADMRDLAEQLDRASDNIASIYAGRTGKPTAFWREMMRAETWLSDAEAVSIGLADRVQGDGPEVAAGWDLTVYGRWNAPFNAKRGANGEFESDDTGTSGDKAIGDGWVMGAGGKPRFDPDGDGDDDATPEGDTDHDYFDADGKQIKPIPPCPKPAAPGPGDRATAVIYGAAADHGPMTGAHTHAHPAYDGPDGNNDGIHGHEHTHDSDNVHQHSHAGVTGVTGHAHPGAQNAASVDNTAWDAAKAWHAGAQSENPEAFYRGICAGKRSGDPSTQAGWALPYKYSPDAPVNAAGVRAALSRLSETKGLINKTEAQDTLQAAMKAINPEWKPGDQAEPALLSAVLRELVTGGGR
jgi:ATP-dependent Clp endopeptidase proteolytic subunit ClpP